MRAWTWLLILVLAGCGTTPRTGQAPQAPRYQLKQRPAGPGALFLIGGGDNETSLLRRFLTVSGGPEAPLVVVPLANGAPEGDRLKAQFETLGARRVTVLSGKPEALEAEKASLKGAYGLYFTGGLPEKLLTAYPPYRDAVTEAWKAGCAVGGTSAGAMVWGSRTIVGGESDAALRGELVMRDGFGLLTRAIVDPHFSERDRFHRLWVAAGADDVLGLGIDPRTAALVTADGKLEALGTGTVTLVRPEGEGTKAARVTVLQSGETVEFGEWRK